MVGFTKGRSPSLILLLITGLLLISLTGCIQEYDLERTQVQRGTLGEELHRIWVKDTERGRVQPEERTALLMERREEFIEAVDRAVPPQELTHLDQFLNGFVPVVQSGYFPALTRRIPLIIDEAIADDELMTALDEGALYTPGDFLAPRKQGRFLQTLTNYPQTAQLLAHAGHLLADRDGLNSRGERDVAVSDSFSNLLRALRDLAEKDPPLEGADSWASTFRDLLVVPDNRLREGEGSRRTFVALFDNRGLPVVRLDNSNQIPAPFRDSNNDGLADVDEKGRFLLTDGTAIALAPLSDEPIDHPLFSRDVDGRVEYSPGQFVFRYVDLTTTALPFLVRVISSLAEKDFFANLAAVGVDAFGPPTGQEDSRGPYIGFSSDHPIVDIFDAVISGLAISELPEVMELVARYIERRTEELATLSLAVGKVRDTIKDFDGADVSPEQTVIFDIMDVLREILGNPQLWADLMEAFRDPIMERSGEAFATLLTHRDYPAVPVLGGPYDTCFQSCKNSHAIGTSRRFDCIRACPSEELFSVPMDFDAPESVENRSIMQRIFHLLRNTAGVEYAMKVEEAQIPGSVDLTTLPPMIILPGAAEAFVRSVAGELRIADYVSPEFLIPGVVTGESVSSVLSIMSSLFGAQLDAQPTPDQITRLFNQHDLRFEEDDIRLAISNPRDADGFIMARHLADGLYASEASGMIDVLYPLARAFARNNREDLLTRIFVIIHEHYSGSTDLYLDYSGDPSPMKGANLRSLEPALLDVVEEGTIFRALRVMALSTRAMSDDEGVSVDERLRQLLYNWVRNDENYGMATGATALILPDGRELSDLSRAEVIIDRIAALSDNIEDNQRALDNLFAVAEAFFDVLLGAEEVNGTTRFKEAGMVAVAQHGMRYLATRAREMESRGEFEPWLTEDLPRTMKALFTSRGFFAGLDLLEALHEDEEGRALLRGALMYYGSDLDRADQFALMAYGLMVAAMDTETLMPFGRFVLRVLDPDRTYETSPFGYFPNSTLLTRVLAMASESDQDGKGLEIIGRLSRSGDGYDAPLAVILDLVLRYFSPEPTSEGSLNREAREIAMGRMGAWFLDTHRGLERYFRLADSAIVLTPGEE